MLNVIPWESLFGGILLGISATILLLVNGKIAGISGIMNGIMSPKKVIIRGDCFCGWNDSWWLD